MLQEMRNKIEQHRQDHPIQSPDYHQWRDNPITQRFFSELEELLIVETDSIPSNGTTEQYAMAACRYAAVRETVGEVLEWKPAEIDDEEI